MWKEILSMCNEVTKVMIGGVIDSSKILENIRPETKDGYRIYYNSPYPTPCPYHKCTTYRTSSEELVYCPVCQRFLYVYH